MCGIAGDVRCRPDSRDDARQRRRGVRRMIAAIRERGPDEFGYYSDDVASLGVCRLAVNDIANGRQPITTADGRFTIVYNGECYSVDALRRRLLGLGHAFRTRGDTEVVLHAYAQWGPGAFERLNGMFALAIWDARRRELVLARDRFGIKPLYYLADQRRLLFGSTVTALAGRGDLDLQIDAESVQMYLASKFIAAPHTIYRGLRKLPGGHWARFRDGELHLHQWWDLPLAAEPSPCPSTAHAAGDVNQMLAAAVDRRRSHERPTGLCLSGGIDSSLLASHLRASGTPAFSIGLRGSRTDETPRAALVAANTQLDLHTQDFPQDVNRLFDDVVRALDEPLGDSSCAALYCLGRRMRDDVTVVLSGTGGDELFGGYRRYLAALLTRQVNRLPGFAQLSRLNRGQAAHDWRYRLAHFAETVGRDPLDSYLRLVDPSVPAVGDPLWRPELRRADGGNRYLDIARQHFDRAVGQTLLQRLCYVDMKTVLVDGYLVKEDRMTMAHSLEGRLPFLDVELAEYAFRLPDRFKIRGLTTKHLLRRLVRTQQLPGWIGRAGKRGFDVPLASWLRGALAERVRDSLLPSDAAIKAYCQPEVVNRVVNGHLSGQENHGRLLWCLLTLETWLACRHVRNRNVHETPRDSGVPGSPGDRMLHQPLGVGPVHSSADGH